MRSFFRGMLDTRDVIFEKRDRPAADVYTEVEKFLCEGNYSTYKKATLLSKLKLSGYDDSFIASQLGVSASTVRTHISSVSNELYKFFGVNFFDMLSNYAENRRTVDAIVYRARHSRDIATTYVLSDVVSKVRSAPLGDDVSYDLSSCHLELDLLRRFSHPFLDEAVKSVDLGKLSYLVDILNGSKGTSEEWSSVVSAIKGEQF